MYLNVEVYSNMPRSWSKAVHEGNSPVLQQEEFGFDQPTLADVYQLFEEIFEIQLKGVKSHFDKLDELADEMRATKQCLAGLVQDPRQSRLAMEADVPSDTKAHRRMEDAVAVQPEGIRFRNVNRLVDCFDQ